MRRVLKHFFIPHADNNFHPHILHTKRAILYAMVLAVSKLLVVLFALLVPAQVWLSPDILSLEVGKIIALTNEVRAQNGVPAVQQNPQLQNSADTKAIDMATYHYFDHIGPEGRDLRYFLGEAGYPYQVAGENLAVGFTLARDLVQAWQKSPTHFSNLIDPDFSHVGVGLQVGEYGQKTSVYVAQHFGRESAPYPARDTQKQNMTYSREMSKIFWQREEQGTRIWAEVVIAGEFIKAEVTVAEHTFELFPAETGRYQGTFFLPYSPEEVFAVVVTPSITIYGKDGVTFRDFVDWESTLVVSPTLFQRYQVAQDKASSLTPIFVVSQTLYLILFIFFALTLLLNIFVQIKKQHPHVIIQTLLLLGLIGTLWVV